jgi:hypothetical protein
MHLRLLLLYAEVNATHSKRDDCFVCCKQATTTALNALPAVRKKDELAQKVALYNYLV